MRYAGILIVLALFLLAGCAHEFEKVSYEGNHPIGEIDARIGGKTVFSNGPDIVGIENYAGIGADRYFCYRLINDTYQCNFYIRVRLGDEASERFSEDVNSMDEDSDMPEYLGERLEIFRDDDDYEEQYLDRDLRGADVITVQVSGHGTGATEKDARADAQKNLRAMYDVLADIK